MVLSCRMDDAQEQDQYEERLRDVFNGFDASGCGSLCLDELSELCQSLHLDDATPALLQTLLQDQDHATARVDFDQFKNALILVLSSTLQPQQTEEEEEEEQALSKPESPEIQPKFVKGSKRYGRRSTPDFIEPISDPADVVGSPNLVEEENAVDNYDSAVPRKRERWNAQETSTEEYEAEGQMHLWNPDEPSTPRRCSVALSSGLEERLREACDALAIAWDGCAGHSELLSLCEHLGLELSVDVLQSLSADGLMNVQEFVSRVVNHNKPPTPSASTPYRQLKRLHSTQPFDEEGRRIATPSALTSSIGMRLFSTLDDGTGFTPVEYVLDAWVEEGIENSAEILQALNFSLDGKLSLSDLTMALESELLVSKSGIHRAAVASFKAEIRSLLEQVDRELREKEKIRSDLEKAEKLKTQMATEVDEHHNAIEQMNNLNLRKLEQDHKEKLAVVRSELMKELDQIQQQAGLQREELEAEVQKIREDESFLRDHLSISVKENRRLEMELLDSTEKLMEAQNQITKLQLCLDNIMKERFGDLDPSCADLFLQEERFKQLRCSYEAQYRELQDRIDELQSELQEFHSLGRGNHTCNKPLSEELESKSPGMESDPGIGSEDVQPFSMSLEAEMMLEQLKEQHLQEMEELRNQLETKINEFDKIVEKQKSTHEEQKAALVLQYQQEVQALKEELTDVENHTEDLRGQLEQAELEKTRVEQAQSMEREELENLQEEEVGKLRQQLAEAHDNTAELEEQLKMLETQQVGLGEETEELRKWHEIEIKQLREEHAKLSEDRLEEERQKVQEEKAELEKRCQREKEQLQQDHEDELKSRLDEAKKKFEEERDEIVQRLTEQWQKEKTQLDEQNNESLQLLLEEEMMKLIREQEEKEAALREQWESERAELQERQEEALLDRAALERSQLQEQFEQKEKKLRGEWERERLQLEEDYEGMLQERLNEERARFESEREEEEKRLEALMVEEKERLEERHQEAMKELSARHCEERDALSSTLDKLREEIAQERKEIEIGFSQRIHEVEDRFSGDQESMAKRFQADVLKLEQHYQSELKQLSEDHEEQKLRWEAQMQEAVEKAEEQTRAMEENVVCEREKLDLQWQKEREEMESVHKQEVQELVIKNRHLQQELDDFFSRAQTKEIELSRQLNDLHNRLQESLETKDELLAESENKALAMELLLNQTVEDFKQEREELLSIQSELEGKSSEMFSMSERQIAERIQLLTERDDLKVKIEELEKLLKQAAVVFELERNDLQERIAVLEEDSKGPGREELMAERDELQDRIKELEVELSSVLSSVEKAKTEECNEDSKCSVAPEVCLEHTDSSDQGLVCLSSFVADQDPEVEMITEDAEARESENENATENSDESLESKQEVEEEPKVCEDSESPSSDGSDPDSKTKAFSQEKQRDVVSSLEALEGVEADEDGGNQAACESCEEDNKPQDVPSLDGESGDEPHHETVVDPSLPQEMCDLGSVDAEVESLPNSSQELERFAAEIKDEHSHDWTDEDADCEDRSCSLPRLQALFKAATAENVLLHEKVSLLQQKAEILENLLVHNGEKVKAGHLILEENYSLKVKMLVLMEHVKELEVKALKMTDLQIRYEDCVCENAKLKEQNSELEKRVWSLESRMSLPVVDELDVMKISELLGEMERHPALVHLDAGRCDATTAAASVDFQDVQDRCEEFEKENSSLRRAITELQDESETMSETTKAHR